MPSLLDSTAALVVIDLQKGIVALPSAEDAGAVIANAARLAHLFRAHSRPVALVTVVGAAPGRVDATHSAQELPPDFAELVPELGPHPDDIIVQKQSWGAFSTTDLDAQLRRRGVTQIVLCGIATSMGVESTARFAHEYGYHVIIVEDAIADPNPAAHEHALSTIFPQIAQVRSTREVGAELAGQA
jgi:nicotinamidase-related amidase